MLALSVKAQSEWDARVAREASLAEQHKEAMKAFGFEPTISMLSVKPMHPDLLATASIPMKKVAISSQTIEIAALVRYEQAVVAARAHELRMAKLSFAPPAGRAASAPVVVASAGALRRLFSFFFGIHFEAVAALENAVAVKNMTAFAAYQFVAKRQGEMADKAQKVLSLSWEFAFRMASLGIAPEAPAMADDVTWAGACALRRPYLDTSPMTRSCLAPLPQM